MPRARGALLLRRSSSPRGIRRSSSPLLWPSSSSGDSPRPARSLSIATRPGARGELAMRARYLLGFVEPVAATTSCRRREAGARGAACPAAAAWARRPALWHSASRCVCAHADPVLLHAWVRSASQEGARAPERVCAPVPERLLGAPPG